jgi:hypothetical protein
LRQQKRHRFWPVEFFARTQISNQKCQDLCVRANGALPHVIRSATANGAARARLKSRVSLNSEFRKVVIPSQSQKLRKLLDKGRGDRAGSARHLLRGQKQVSGGPRIIAGCRQQDRITQRVFVLVAAHHPDGGGGAFERLTRAPAAGPDGVQPNQIIQVISGRCRRRRPRPPRSHHGRSAGPTRAGQTDEWAMKKGQPAANPCGRRYIDCAV